MDAPAPHPLVSIVIPAYNAVALLGETLESIAAQEHTDWELIVVEDGTDDGTRALVERFAEGRTQTVSYLRHETNKGLPATRNTGIGVARGDWVAFVDSDDLWEPRHLRNLVELAHEGTGDLLHTGVVLFQSDTHEVLSFREPDERASAELPLSLFDGRYPIQPSSSMVRRALLASTGGFDPTFRYVEDREYWIRLVRAGARIRYCPERTCLYRQHASAMTNNAERMSLGVAMVHDKHGDWELIPRPLRHRLAASAWLHAGRIVLRSKPGLARTHFSRSLHWRRTGLAACAYWLASWAIQVLPTKARRP